MNKAISAALTEAGTNVSETLARFSGNEELYLRFLRRFSGDPSFAEMERALGDGRLRDAADACHTLKGISANLGLSPLCAACTELMAAFRGGDPAELERPLTAVREAYDRAVELVRRVGD